MTSRATVEFDIRQIILYNYKYNSNLVGGLKMQSITYSDFRKNLAASLDKVNEDHVPILITRQFGKAAVVMSQEDFKSYEETAYLMSSINNAYRLNQAIEQLEGKKGKIKRLIEE